MNDYELIPSFGRTLFQENFDITTEYLELTLDAMTQNDVLRDFPIVGSVVGAGKTVVAVRDRHLLKKTLEFIRTVNSGVCDRKKINAHRDKLMANPRKMRSELERVLILLDNQIEEEKSRILGKFYKRYLFEEMNWEQFTIFADILNVISIYDFKALKYIYDREVLKKEDGDKVNIVSIKRLDSVGLIEFFSGNLGNVAGHKNVSAIITEVGKSFYEVAVLDC